MAISSPADRLTPGYVPMIDGATLPGVTPFLTFGNLHPTPTPLVISETIDLPAGIPNEQKCVFVIRRASGLHEQILIPIEAWDHQDKLLRLNPGDTMVNVFPWIIILTPDP